MNAFHFEGNFHVRRQAASVEFSAAALLGEGGQKDGSFGLQAQPRLRDSLNFILPRMIVLLRSRPSSTSARGGREGV